MSTVTRNAVSKRRVAEPTKPRSGRRNRGFRRTTIALSFESQEIVERFRSANGTSTSMAIDQIILRSEPKASRLKNVGGFLVLDSPGKRPKVSLSIEDMKRAEDAMDREYLARLTPETKKKKSRR